jgi:hypothetical protein
MRKISPNVPQMKTMIYLNRMYEKGLILNTLEISSLLSKKGHKKQRQIRRTL